MTNIELAMTIFGHCHNVLNNKAHYVTPSNKIHIMSLLNGYKVPQA